MMKVFVTATLLWCCFSGAEAETLNQIGPGDELPEGVERVEFEPVLNLNLMPLSCESLARINAQKARYASGDYSRPELGSMDSEIMEGMRACRSGLTGTRDDMYLDLRIAIYKASRELVTAFPKCPEYLAAFPKALTNCSNTYSDGARADE